MWFMTYRVWQWDQPTSTGCVSPIFWGENTLVVLAGLVRGKSQQETIWFIYVYINCTPRNISMFSESENESYMIIYVYNCSVPMFNIGKLSISIRHAGHQMGMIPGSKPSKKQASDWGMVVHCFLRHPDDWNILIQLSLILMILVLGHSTAWYLINYMIKYA